MAQLYHTVGFLGKPMIGKTRTIDTLVRLLCDPPSPVPVLLDGNWTIATELELVKAAMTMVTPSQQWIEESFPKFGSPSEPSEPFLAPYGHKRRACSMTHVVTKYQPSDRYFVEVEYYQEDEILSKLKTLDVIATLKRRSKLSSSLEDEYLLQMLDLVIPRTQKWQDQIKKHRRQVLDRFYEENGPDADPFNGELGADIPLDYLFEYCKLEVKAEALKVADRLVDDSRMVAGKKIRFCVSGPDGNSDMARCFVRQAIRAITITGLLHPDRNEFSPDWSRDEYSHRPAESPETAMIRSLTIGVPSTFFRENHLQLMDIPGIGDANGRVNVEIESALRSMNTAVFLFEIVSALDMHQMVGRLRHMPTCRRLFFTHVSYNSSQDSYDVGREEHAVESIRRALDEIINTRYSTRMPLTFDVLPRLYPDDACATGPLEGNGYKTFIEKVLKAIPSHPLTVFGTREDYFSLVELKKMISKALGRLMTVTTTSLRCYMTKIIDELFDEQVGIFEDMKWTMNLSAMLVTAPPELQMEEAREQLNAYGLLHLPELLQSKWKRVLGQDLYHTWTAERDALPEDPSNEAKRVKVESDETERIAVFKVRVRTQMVQSLNTFFAESFEDIRDGLEEKVREEVKDWLMG